MCEISEKIYRDGMAKGIAKGMAEGITKGRTEEKRKRPSTCLKWECQKN